MRRWIGAGLSALVTAAMFVGCGDDETDGGTQIEPPPPPPPGALALAFESVPYDTSLSYITDLAFAPGDSGEGIAVDLYGGFEVVQLGDDGLEVVLAGALDGVFAEYDAGLLAVAFDPAFADNGFFYMAHNLAQAHVVVRRYTLDRNDADATVMSAVDILDLDVGSSPRWHNISSMGFDEDGVMWMLVGDKGLSLPDSAPASSVAQDPASILGTLIRIAPSTDPMMGGYTVPSSVEPYDASGDSAVVAVGIRSPWKGLYHEGRWIYGDVGLDDVEEINVLSGPANLGWPIVEGPCADDVFGNEPECATLLDPWIHYGRSNSHPFVLADLDANPTNKRSVYVGWIYQERPDDPYDGRWNDVLVWGDAFVGNVRAAELDGDPEGWHIGHLDFPSAWAQGPDGYVYVVALSELPSDEDPNDVSGEPSPLLRAVLADE